MSTRSLLNFLLDLQRECGGVIPFERYMQEALYHPEHGYYSAQIRNVGAMGDFSTSATLDAGLGIALAAWISGRVRETEWRRIPVIEVGAGSGDLASSVLRHLDWKTRLRIDYMIHETSPILRARQEKRLQWQRRLRFPSVCWIDSLAETLQRSEGRALIFSNELVDAFPCRLFQKTATTWQELGVSISEAGGLSEKIVGEVPTDSWFAQFAHLPEGQRIERTDSYQQWLRGWSSHWKAGALLTIDYGDTVETLYKRRQAGSLRAYHRHQRLTGRDLYARFGKQDLTADVNFTDLMRWGTEFGWKNKPLLTQHEFIESWVSKKIDRSAFPAEAGEAFKILEQTPF